MGKPKADGSPRPILIKFIGYRVREAVYKARGKLPRGIYVNEDLTWATSNLAYTARELRRDGAIAETWVYDGKVFVKSTETSRP